MSTEATVQSHLKLTSTLEEMVSHYRTLLDLLVNEKNYLVDAKIDLLHETNHSKEVILAKIRNLDIAREKQARELAQLLRMSPQNARLLELAKSLSGLGQNEGAERFQQLHATLKIMIERATELNKENAYFAQNALKNLNLSLGNVKETLATKKTYERKGKVQEGATHSGNFVSKEA